MKDTKEEKEIDKVPEKKNIFEGLITVYYKGQTIKVL